VAPTKANSQAEILQVKECILVPRGRDVFKSPQSRSESRSVGKDESARPVGRQVQGLVRPPTLKIAAARTTLRR
jgi:hypothetical protein